MCEYVYICIRIQVCVYIRVYTCMCVCVHICVYAYRYICVYVCICVYIYMCVYAIGIMVRVFANGLVDRGSIPDRVLPKTQKWYLIPPCLAL